MPEPLLQISYSLATIENELHQFWQSVYQYPVLAFSGEMGAGKTTFIHALCRYLGVTDAVGSPTFSLINEYHFEKDGRDHIIYHMDWYRLHDTQEAIAAGLEDALCQQGSYCFIEWAEKAGDLLPRPYVRINIEVLSETERQLTASLIR